MTESVVGGRTDSAAQGRTSAAEAVDAGHQRVAIAFASGLLSDPPGLPLHPLLELALVGGPGDGATVTIDGADGPVVVAAAGSTDGAAIETAVIEVRGRALGSVHLHGAAPAGPRTQEGAFAGVDIDLTAPQTTARRLADLIAELLTGLPGWGLDTDDPVGTFVVDQDGTVVSATPSIIGMFGYPMADLVGTSALDLLHPDDRDVAALAFSRTVGRGGRRLPREWHVLHASGDMVTVQIKGDSRLDDPAVRGVAYTVHTTGARPAMDRVLAAHMRVLEDVARGLPVHGILGRIVDLVDSFVDGYAMLFTTAEAAPTRDAAARAAESTEPASRQVLVLDRAPALPDSLSARVATPQPVCADGAPWGQAVFRGESGIDDRLAGGAFTGWRTELHALGIRSAYAYPFRPDGADRLGAIAVLSRREGPPSDEEAHVLKVAAGLARLAIERDLDAAELRRQATHDDLTGLANRALLVDLLEHVLANLTPDHLAGLVFIDIDRFKLVNDSYGHQVGDDLLRSVAARLWASAPPGVTIARFGADEFVALLPTLGSPHDALAAADAFNLAMQAPFQLGGTELRATLSMGVAFAHPPQDGTVVDAGLLLRDADVAVSRAKAQGRDRIEIFDDVLREAARARLVLEQELRGALAHRELVVHYQPELDLRTGEVVAVEALVRWQHPERGLLLPGAFIELAEETGLVIPLGAQVLSHAAEQAARWQLAGQPPFTVWVNAAMRQLDPARRQVTPLAHVIAELLAQWELPPFALGVEITERDLVRDLDDTIAQLRELAALGVRLAVDDFGTGYASLTYLKRLPVDVVKIDQSFVAGLGSDPQDDAIVSAVIQLATALGKDVVAEGVETEQQRDRLIELGCHRAQGFLLARPAPANERGYR